LERLIDLIDEQLNKREKVSLVGTSAGGSAVINAFAERRDKVHRVINVCGRLREGTQTGFRSFKERTKSSPPFAQSIEFCETHLESLTENDKRKIMTVRSMFGDELVPSDTVIIEGANNIQVPAPEHVFTITTALTLFSKRLIDFLKQ